MKIPPLHRSSFDSYAARSCASPPHPTVSDLETMRKALTLSRLDIVNPAIKQAKMSEEIGLG